MFFLQEYDDILNHGHKLGPSFNQQMPGFAVGIFFIFSQMVVNISRMFNLSQVLVRTTLLEYFE